MFLFESLFSRSTRTGGHSWLPDDTKRWLAGLRPSCPGSRGFTRILPPGRAPASWFESSRRMHRSIGMAVAASSKDFDTYFLK